MTKSSKSTATIRRRKNKSASDMLFKMRRGLSNKTSQSQPQEETEGDVFFYKEVLGSSAIEKIMSSDKTIFLGLLVIRLVNAMLIQTYFVPDEFWQSVEVAHKMVFDYGYMTWEWQAGIRSYAYPLVFATLYKALYILGLDNRLLLIRGPRLVQGAMASVGDLYLFFLSRRLAGRDVAKWALLCQLLSWFTGYCITRTLSNSAEAVLVTAALYYFPWPRVTQPKGYSRRFVLLAAWSVVVRPTAAILWVLLCSWHLQHNKGPALWQLLRHYITGGLTVLGISTVVDRVWYGRWVLVHLNFLHFNVLSGGSGFYGSHPWYWYLTQGLPAVLGPHALLLVVGAWQASNKVLLMLLLWKIFVLSFLAHKEFRFLLPVLPLAMHYCGVCFHTIASPPHTNTTTSKATKTPPRTGPGSTEQSQTATEADPGSEHIQWNGTDESGKKSGHGPPTTSAFSDMPEATGRQLEGAGDEVGGSKGQPPVPSLGEGEKKGEGEMATEGEKVTEGERVKEEQETEGERAKEGERVAGERGKEGERGTAGERASQARRARKVRFLVLALAASNLLPLLYFSLIHQRGTIDVMTHLHDAVARRARPPLGSAGAVDALFLMPCHSTPFYSFLHANVSLRFLTCPPNLHHTPNYTDEADRFYRDPASWLGEEYHQAPQRPLPTHVVYFDVLAASIADFLALGGYNECARFFHTHMPEGRVGSYVIVSCR